MMTTKNHKNCCSFFGHTDIVVTGKLKEKLIKVIEYMAAEFNVRIFLFGNCDKFKRLCHAIVTKLKEKYPDIKRFCYDHKSESCFFDIEIDKWKRVTNKLDFLNSKYSWPQENFEQNKINKINTHSLSIIKKIQAMINNSGHCIFYYYENQQSTIKINNELKFAYDYAKHKNKPMINILEL